MRLLYLSDRRSARGGADQHLLQVIGAAVAAGDRVTVAFGRDDGSVEPDDGVEWVRVRGLASPVAGVSRLGRLVGLLANADVVHVQNVMNPTALEMASATGRAVVTVQDHRVFCPGAGKTLPKGTRCDVGMGETACRGCLPDERYRRRTLELVRQRLAAVRGAAAVLVLSGYMATELEGVGIVSVDVLPPWVETGPPRDEPGRYLVLGGRLVPHKGTLDAWRAWCEGGRPLPLVVAGAGPLEPELEGADRRGWLPPEELRSLLRGARALLFPARWQEPFGILGVEALAEGTPVIVADSGGTSEWSGAGCLRVPAGDVAAMAAAIEGLAGDPQLALALGRAGRASVRERFARDRIEPRLRAVYRRVASV